MLRLHVVKPAGYTLGRTQSFRMILWLEKIQDELSSSSSEEAEELYRIDRNLFLVYREPVSAVEHFEGVCELKDLVRYSGATNPRRTYLVDLWFMTRQLADDALFAIVEDINSLLSAHYGRSVKIELSGGTT